MSNEARVKWGSMRVSFNFLVTSPVFDVWLTLHRSSIWNKKPTRCHLVLYLFLLYKLLNMFRATLCTSSGAEDLVVFFHVWCSAVTMVSVISVYVEHIDPQILDIYGNNATHCYSTTPHAKKKCH